MHCFQEITITFSIDFLVAIMGNRNQWNDIFKALKENNCLTRILYSGKISVVKKSKTKTVSDIEKNERVHYQQTCSKEICNGVIQVEGKFILHENKNF